MLITALEREREQTYQKGKVEGKMEGRIEGKIEDAKVMLSKGMDISLISEITDLSTGKILQLKSERR